MFRLARDASWRAFWVKISFAHARTFVLQIFRWGREKMTKWSDPKECGQEHLLGCHYVSDYPANISK